MHDWYPDLQIWRRTGTNTFTKVGNTTLRVETGNRDMTYSPPTPLSFQTGDVLGIFQPDNGRNRLRLYFQSGAGPQNYTMKHWIVTTLLSLFLTCLFYGPCLRMTFPLFQWRLVSMHIQ